MLKTKTHAEPSSRGPRGSRLPEIQNTTDPKLPASHKMFIPASFVAPSVTTRNTKQCRDTVGETCPPIKVWRTWPLWRIESMTPHVKNREHDTPVENGEHDPRNGNHEHSFASLPARLKCDSLPIYLSLSLSLSPCLSLSLSLRASSFLCPSLSLYSFSLCSQTKVFILFLSIFAPISGATRLAGRYPSTVTARVMSRCLKWVKWCSWFPTDVLFVQNTETSIQRRTQEGKRHSTRNQEYFPDRQLGNTGNPHLIRKSNTK